MATPSSERPTLKLKALTDGDLVGLDALSDCRNQHAELKADEARWAEARLVGYSGGVDPGDPRLQLRNCPTCKSTVAKEV